ncbi:recombinase family protein [Microtetraspora malaysiensis]|uniref:recombinase family protein n=1 Tax=Microtetraspora malaysiensis TaxID=161358 RepID=UPI003D8B15A5
MGDTLVARGARLPLGGSVYDPADPMSKMFFNMLAVFAEFEADLLKMRTREGIAIARSHGKLKGRQPKLTARQQAELVRTSILWSMSLRFSCISASLAVTSARWASRRASRSCSLPRPVETSWA